ncbi:hypothetical protein QPK87_15295 [Kamptonema cortianum]|nr:hypothetical protein [Oscillatoria laete-virens]MDK3157928.1 hypothetical protein [Kamptonema cortianum]MDL5046056.1 hypothetical protein [Oscillatoria amoena NRMC-F 0135]MDL5052763.1 hypothetical protein [Oscillatoria laete-virens NRMC-F 0139]
MNSDTLEIPTAARSTQVDADTRIKPKTVARLNDWQYVERSIHRMICGWGRCFGQWDDKAMIHRMVWEQAECVRRLRTRIGEFPGGKPDDPVSGRLEKLVNTVLTAPSVEDFTDGLFQILTNALVKSYMLYSKSAHHVHDAPTIGVIHEICTIKEQQRLWLRELRRRRPHVIDPAYKVAIEAALAECQQLHEVLPVTAGSVAAPCGVNTLFRPVWTEALPAVEGMPDANAVAKYINIDFHTNVETRRIFWCYGYMLEFQIPDDQIVWIYDSPDMPWEFHHDVSRHLWDESRHGLSGYSRFLDFGLDMGKVGYVKRDPKPAKDYPKMDAKSLYDAVYSIGMLAETGHFNVKNEAYADFRDGGDMESAEMMLFDIIDETTHVQYAHRWLPTLAKRAGVELGDYKTRAAQELKKWGEDAEKARQEFIAKLDTSPDNPDYKRYLEIRDTMRRQKPLSNARTCPERSKLHYVWG